MNTKAYVFTILWDMEYTTLNIFDFDGTIYNSPVPIQKLWDRKTYGRLLAPKSDNGLGWYQHPMTLDAEYTGIERFNQSIVDRIDQSINSGALTVLLTGRHEKHRANINRILQMGGVVVHQVLLKELENDRTFDFKASAITKLLNDNPLINQVSIWDDRNRHIPKFEKYLREKSTQMQLTWYINKVEAVDMCLDEDVERDIVSQLSRN